MTIIQREAQVSSDSLLKAVEQLNTEDLDEFTINVLKLRAQRQAHGLPTVEAELIEKINQTLSAQTQQRFEDLNARRRAHTLTREEHTELLDLIQQTEALNVRRIEALVTLAQLRKTSLKALMKKLGIKAPQYA